MATLRLKVSDKILDKVLWLLGQFKSEGLQIIDSEQVSEGHKADLENELTRTNSGAAKHYSVDELDMMMEKIIQKYEG